MKLHPTAKLIIFFVIFASAAICEELSATDKPDNLPSNFPSPFSLEEKASRHSLTPHLAIISDPEGKLQAREILEKIHLGHFQLESKEAVNFGLDLSVQWVAFLIENPHLKPKDIYLENTFALTDQMDLYQIHPRDIQLLSSQGDQVPISTRDVISRQPVFHLSVSPGYNLYLLRLEAENVLQLNLKVWEKELFHQRNSVELSVIGLLLGFHLVIAFYNFFLFISFREWMYLTYVSYVFANAAYQAANLGYLQLINYQLFSWETLDNRVMIFWVDIVIISAFYFSDSLLSLKKHLPYTKYLMKASIGISVTNLVINIFFSTYFAAITCLINSTFAISILITSGLILCYKRYKTAYYYTFAWGFYLIGATGNVFSLLGILPASEWNQWGQLFGGAIEVVLLSLVVASRMSRVQNQLTKYVAEQNQIEKIVKTAQFLRHRQAQPELSPSLQYTFFTQSANKVGGDWIGMVTHHQENKVYICMGDVMGHGLSPAMISMIAAGASRGAIFDSFRQDIPENQRLPNIGFAVNNALYDKCQDLNTFITMSLISLDWQTGELWVLNAGHTPVLRFGSQQKCVASAPGSLIGMFQEPNFNLKQTKLITGDTIFLYTDGLLENSDQNGKHIRMKEISQILESDLCIESKQNDILLLMNQRWQQHPIEDDITFFILQWLDDAPEEHSSEDILRPGA
ncbi:MAG: SpoIIE family protein phosphatase [Oligoflexus sp.]